MAIVDLETLEANKKATQEISQKWKEINADLRAGKIISKELHEEFKKFGYEVDKIDDDLKDAVVEIEHGVEATQEWANATKDVVKNLTGLSIPALKSVELLKTAANLTIDWVNYTTEVNRQYLDINAGLGNIGDKAYVFDQIIADTAEKFKMLPSELRETTKGLTAIGFTLADVEDGLDTVVSLNKLWSEITPEKQMQLMSDYMKEFGYSGKEAANALSLMYETSIGLKKELRDTMPQFDIKRFVDQTHEVALSMRQYGLETQDAIALTSTLARLGVEQARIPEIAKQLGTIGMGGAAGVAYSSQQFLMPEMRGRARELREERIESGGEMGEEEARLRKRLEIGGRGIAGQMGLFLTADSGERQRAQMGVLEQMTKIGTGGRGLGSAAPEEMIGAFSQLDLPLVGKMSIEASKEFAKAVKNLSEDGVLTPEGMSKAFEKGVMKQEELNDAIKTREKLAEQAAKDTTTIAKDISIIKETVGQWFRYETGGTTVQAAAKVAVTNAATTGTSAWSMGGAFESQETIDWRREQNYQLGEYKRIEGKASPASAFGPQSNTQATPDIASAISAQRYVLELSEEASRLFAVSSKIK